MKKILLLLLLRGADLSHAAIPPQEGDMIELVGDDGPIENDPPQDELQADPVEAEVFAGINALLQVLQDFQGQDFDDDNVEIFFDDVPNHNVAYARRFANGITDSQILYIWQQSVELTPDDEGEDSATDLFRATINQAFREE